MINFTLDFNQLHQIEPPQIFLCHKSKKKYGEIMCPLNLRIAVKLSTFSECSFTVYKEVNGKTNPLWDKITNLKLIYIPKFGYFEIYVNKTCEQTNYKNITGKSLEVELGQIYLNNFQINDTTDETYDEYEIVKFYDPLDEKHSMLHLALEKAPSWTIKHVDDELCNMQRTFSVDNVAIYDFLTGDVANEFECIFIFDTFNKNINVYSLSTYGNDTVIYLSRENYINEFGIEADAGAIKNCFKVVGGDGINIQEVNPNGTDYIWSLSEETKSDMPRELVQKLNEYDILYASKATDYETLMTNLQAQLDVILELQNRTPSASDGEDWTKYGLVALNGALSAFQSVEDGFKSSGISDKFKNENLYETQYVPNHNKIMAIQSAIATRQSEINDTTAAYTLIRDDISRLQKVLDLQEYLGKELWLTLSTYRREYRYENTNYSVTELTTDNERIEMEKALIAEAASELQKANSPQYTATVNMSNLLASEKLFKQNIGKFTVGNFIRIDDDDNVSKIRLTSMEIDFENIENISVEFSDMTKVNGIISDVKSLLDKAASAATSYNTVMRQYDANKNNMTYVNNIRKDGLSSMLTATQNASNQEFTIGNRGIIGKEWNEEKQAYEDEQIHILKNQVVFTDDNWKTARAGFGKIKFGNSSAYGLIADVLIGKLLVSEELLIENKSGSFMVDKDGVTITNLDLKITNDTNSVIIDPNHDKIFQILKGTKELLYIDTATADLVYSGKIKGGSIDIGNETNTVTINPSDTELFKILKGDEKVLYFDEDGNGNFSGEINAKSGTIGGFTIKANELAAISPNSTISGGTISGSLMTSSTIKGSSLYTGNDDRYFKVDLNGFVTYHAKKSSKSYEEINFAYSSLMNGGAAIALSETLEGEEYVSTFISTARITTPNIECDTLFLDGANMADELKLYAKLSGDKFTGTVEAPNLWLNSLVNSSSGTDLVIQGTAVRTKSSSSKRFKNTIKDVEDVYDLTKLYDIPIRTFVYNDNYLDKEDERYGKEIVGFIAEEVDDLFPIGVNHDNDGSPIMWNSNILLPAMLWLIKDLNKRLIGIEKS